MSAGLNSNTSYRSLSTIIDIRVQCPLLSIITQRFIITVEWTLNIIAAHNDTHYLVFNADITYISSKYGSYIIGCIAVYLTFIAPCIIVIAEE